MAGASWRRLMSGVQDLIARRNAVYFEADQRKPAGLASENSEEFTGRLAPHRFLPPKKTEFGVRPRFSMIERL